MDLGVDMVVNLLHELGSHVHDDLVLQVLDILVTLLSFAGNSLRRILGYPEHRALLRPVTLHGLLQGGVRLSERRRNEGSLLGYLLLNASPKARVTDRRLEVGDGLSLSAEGQAFFIVRLNIGETGRDSLLTGVLIVEARVRLLHLVVQSEVQLLASVTDRGRLDQLL